MTVGRKPTPTALKLVKGNPGKRALLRHLGIPSGEQYTSPAEIFALRRG